MLDAAGIDAAIKTKGVDEQALIDILTRRSWQQRKEIAFEYERIARKDLATALKAALSGSLEALMLGLLKSPSEFDAAALNSSMKGLGTDEETLIELVCSRASSNEEMVNIKKVYKDSECWAFKQGNQIRWINHPLVALTLFDPQTKRDEPTNVVDYEKIDEDARALYDAGVKIKGTDVATWITIMSQRSVPHLQRVFDRYKSYSPYDMKDSIRKEVKGDLEKSFLTLVECFENKQVYFANRLNEAMKGKTAKDKVVTRILVSRCEVDLMKIRTEFKRQHKRTLYQTIGEHTKGDYQRALLSLCGGDD
uniref:Annexin n=1 Tax=Neogobius melanostomus TaxID=47308 RepID=A0A8C6TAJ7_9GOBI